MGNSSSKDSRHASEDTSPGGTGASSSQHAGTERTITQIYGPRSGSGRGSRQDLSFLGLRRDRGGGEDAAQPERPKETKQERDARRAERERQARIKERERSIREEGVDGGFLVTLGTYTGPEDFSKPTVRQLQVSDVLGAEMSNWRAYVDRSYRSRGSSLHFGKA